jgi:hypothetical protein
MRCNLAREWRDGGDRVKKRIGEASSAMDRLIVGCCSPVRSLVYVRPSLFSHSFGIKCNSGRFCSSNFSKTGSRAITYNVVTSKSK